MSKNLTRKGIAFGALVALGSSVIAGTPALAAGELVVAPSAGTSYNAVSGTVFNLKTTFAPGYTPSSYEQLKYQIKTDANSAVTYAVATSARTLAQAAAGTSVAVSTTAVSGATSGAGALTVNYLGLAATTTTVTSSVEVTAFVDANNDNALTAGEWNTVKTVTFKKLADITPVVTLAQPATGDTTVSATVAWGDLNVEQASNTGTYLVAAGSANSSLGVEFNVAGAGYPAALATGVSYSSTTGKYSKTVSALASGATVAARAVFAANAYAATTDSYSATALGTAVSATASARSISDTVGLVSNVVKGNDAIATSATTMVTNTAATVRTNGTFVAQVKAFDRETTPAAKSGVAVSATVSTNATLRPASTGVTEISVTVNGTKYTTNAALAAAPVALTTDASGLASVTVSSFGLTSGSGTVTVTFAAQNLSSAVVATVNDATYTVSDDAAAAVVATNKNTAVAFNYSVKDQFGVLSTRTNERLVITSTQSGGTIANQFVAVSAGKASFSVTPATDITTDITVQADLQVSSYNSTTGVTTWADNGTDVANRTIKIRAAAYSFSTAPAVAEVNGAAYNATSNATQPLTTAALADLAAVATGSTWAKITLTGSNAGEKLTASGSNVFLSIDGAAASANTATKTAEAAAAVVWVASNTTGTKTITITNGTVTSTVSVVFRKAAETAGSVITITAPATAAPGTSFVVTGVITDKFGNTVDTTQGSTSTLSVKYDGPGIVIPASNTITETDANGAFSFRVILGAAETGVGTVTVTYDADGAGTTSAAITKTATVIAGAVSAAVAGGTKVVKLTVRNAANQGVVVTVNGKVVLARRATTAIQAFSIKTTAGKKSVVVKVAGKTVATRTVTVK